eukprot:6203706-Pleurochrysis_carterae.AAC.1
MHDLHVLTPSGVARSEELYLSRRMSTQSIHSCGRNRIKATVGLTSTLDYRYCNHVIIKIKYGNPKNCGDDDSSACVALKTRTESFVNHNSSCSTAR